jgi:alpha-amylase/alpha-mannosidase (GH57 family)
MRYVCMHGHFYQPPREDPWTGRIPREPSARPYANWNERIAAECYAPNAGLTPDGGGAEPWNNFAFTSFDAGPTLLAWLERARPGILARLREADRESAARLGEGNAVAQAYGHVILPLATPEDRRTQILWGLAEFRHRFGRDARGIWLPETAADAATLREAARSGVAFTVLAPGQADRVRRIGEDAWRPAATALDTRRAYRWRDGAGASLALFFFDGALSHRIAFDPRVAGGPGLRDALLVPFPGGSQRDGEPPSPLVNAAVDGETFGHHHRGGAAALADALRALSARSDVVVTNYAAYLAAHPAEWDVEIVPNSSWSCAHGVERWRGNCGCRLRDGTQQRWRRPLRDAIVWLKAALDDLFAIEGRRIFTDDPWRARDRYIDVVLAPDRWTPWSRSEVRELADGPRAWQLLEMQRFGMQMQTSCGWFFDDVAELEGAIVLRAAMRAIRLAQLFGRDPEPAFLRRLAEAPTNRSDIPDAAAYYRSLVRPPAYDPAA